jgi:peptide/nickel transport system substrate-binding protein
VLEDDRLLLYTYVSRGYGYVGWNNDAWPFDDARVRRAMTHAIDRANIIESVFYGYAQPAAAHVISTMWASNDEIEPLPYDPEKAAALLHEAGFRKNRDGVLEKDGKPFRFKLVTNAENDVRREICQLIQQDLSRIGVKAEVEAIEFNLMSQQLKLHQIDAYVAGWRVATKVDLKPIWHSTSNQGQFNYVNFADVRVDEIIETARTMGDFQKAKPLWDELQEILHREQPYTMLYEPRDLVAISNRIVNVKTTALRSMENLDEWWFLEGD